MDMDVEIHIDRRRCIGAGQCVHVAHGAFDQDESAMAFVTDPRGERPERIVAAVTACPMEAISLHVSGVAVGPRELRDWAVGARSDDPLVERIAAFADEHHELRDAIAAGGEGGLADRAVVDALRSHLLEEADEHPALVSLVSPGIVDVFGEARTLILGALADLGAARAEPERRTDVERLTQAIRAHIELEEAVLFPMALSALARHEGP